MKYEEWYEFAMEHGTSGEMVFDILKDWELREKEIIENYFKRQNLRIK